MFGKILETKYPESIQSSTVSLNDLLHWHLWPKFFQVLTDGMCFCSEIVTCIVRCLLTMCVTDTVLFNTHFS